MWERRYWVGEQWYNLRPDGLAQYRVGQQYIRFSLEWNWGTMNVRDLGAKFASYSEYINSREWAKAWPILPKLFCIASDNAQERRIQRVAQAQLPGIFGLVLWTTTDVLLKEHGPLAPIWTTVMLASDQIASPSGSHKQLLFQMHTEKEVTWYVVASRGVRSQVTSFECNSKITRTSHWLDPSGRELH